MNESITRAAGAVHGQEMPPEAMEALIRSLGRDAAAAHDASTAGAAGPRRPPRSAPRRWRRRWSGAHGGYNRDHNLAFL